MTPKQLKAVAKEYGLNAKGLSPTEFIQSIQREEGNFDCYASASAGECDQELCRWRGHCLATESPVRHCA